MKLSKFLSVLLPTFEKGRLLEEIQVVRSEVKEMTLPPYEQAGEFYRTAKLHAKTTQKYDTDFAKGVSPRAKGNYIVIVRDVLKGLDDRLDVINRLVEKAFSKDVVSSRISFLRANLMQYAEVASFASRYARRLLLWTLGEEQENAEYKIPKGLTKADSLWIQENRSNFIQCLSILAIETNKMEGMFGAIPDAVVSPTDVQMVEQTLGATKVDPFGFGLINARLNPIYYIRMAVAEWQVSRYKAAVEEKRALEYRLLIIKDGSEPDAKLQQEIEYTEGRLAKLNKKIADMEEDFNG